MKQLRTRLPEDLYEWVKGEPEGAQRLIQDLLERERVRRSRAAGPPQEVLSKFLKAIETAFPLAPPALGMVSFKTYSGESYEGRYRYLHHQFEDFRVGFRFLPGGALYQMSWTLSWPNAKLEDHESTVYRELCRRFGEPAHRDKFAFRAQSGLRTVTGLTLYEWERPQARVTFRCFFEKDAHVTNQIVEFWNPQFMGYYDRELY